jgi:carbon dioxide concentrating mechanism protein CcmM
VTGLAEVATDSYVDPLAVLEGEVTIAGGVWIGPFASVRAAEGAPIRIGPDVALGDAVVIQSAHSFGNEGALPGPLPARGAPSAVDIGAGVAIDAQAQLHGPVWIEGYTWIGPQALVAGAHVARGAIVEPGAVVLNVRVPPGCYVPAGALIDRQEVADRLPEITASYRFRDRGRAVLAAGARRVRAHTEARGVGP